jgi:hypothetical protein
MNVKLEKLSPQFEDTICGSNLELGNKGYKNAIASSVLLALIFCLGQGSISISYHLDMTISTSIVFLILLPIGIKAHPAAMLRDIFASPLINYIDLDRFQ